MNVWLNGNWIDEAQAQVSIRDTGLLHAAGVFTTLRGSNGRVFALDRHLQRLRRSCAALFIPLQYSDEALSEAVRQILLDNQLTEARLRLTVTRGIARQDPLHGMHLTPTVFLTATGLEPYPEEYYERGMTVVLLDEQKLNPFDVQAGHKTLNYFSRLAALREANRRSAGEALWFDICNQLQSGSISNVFVVKDGKLLTPPTRDESHHRSCVLPGVTRGVVMELAAEIGIQARPEPIDVNTLLEAEEVFLTNSIMKVMPVCRIERKAIGDDRPGALTRKLAAALEQRIQSTLAP
jgi:branched-chain amino acid aminotransferase